MKLVGVDPSLAGTATSTYDDGTITTGRLEALVDARRALQAHPAARRALLGGILVERCRGAALVVIEGYAYGIKAGSALVTLGELGGVLRDRLWAAGLHYLEVPPSNLKKYATGKGNASKDEVLAAAVHRSRRLLRTNDEADSWWLLQMALCHYGLPHTAMPKAHRAALDKVEWPAINLEVPAHV